jgi:mRNA interferase HicA
MATVNVILKLLKKEGWYLYRSGGNHDLYRHKNKPNQIPIPRHGSKELANGTLNSIMKAAGLK